jgi:hypothetical protein
MKKYKFLWLLLMIVAIASTSNAQQASPNRPKPTINGPRVVAESTAQTTILKRCSEVAPDAEFLIPKSDQFGGRTEASGSGAYAYKPAGDCRYWVVDFLMNRYSNTWIHPESGATIRENVEFRGDAFDLPSSRNANNTRPIVEEDCKRLEVDVLIFRKDPNENIFKLIKSGRGRFGSWSDSNKSCSLEGLPGLHAEKAPTANMLKIRIAVRVKLRGSWQQAAGYATLTPPS